MKQPFQIIVCLSKTCDSLNMINAMLFIGLDCFIINSHSVGVKREKLQMLYRETFIEEKKLVVNFKTSGTEKRTRKMINSIHRLAQNLKSI